MMELTANLHVFRGISIYHIKINNFQIIYQLLSYIQISIYHYHISIAYLQISYLQIVPQLLGIIYQERLLGCGGSNLRPLRSLIQGDPGRLLMGFTMIYPQPRILSGIDEQERSEQETALFEWTSTGRLATLPFS